MALAFDRRSELKGQPVAHALVVGISRYPHLPLKSMAARDVSELVPVGFAARSAWIFADWLVRHSQRLATPLATCRLLLAPSEKEVRAVPAHLRYTGTCNVTDFAAAASEWRRDAVDNRKSTLIFYFAGHSLELSRTESALAFEDFGDDVGPTLRATVSLSNLLGGLAPSNWQPDIGRQQFMFVDSDRIRVDEFLGESLWRTTDVFDVPRAAPFDDRRTCVLFGTVAGGSAYADRDRTFFNMALMRCLEGAAAEPAPPDPRGGKTEWRISTRSLVSGVQMQLDRLNRSAGLEEGQRVAWSIQGEDAVVVRLDATPAVELRVRVFPAAGEVTLKHLELRNDRFEVVRVDPLDAKMDADGSWVVKVAAGLYQVKVLLGEGKREHAFERIIQAVPPQVELALTIGS